MSIDRLLKNICLQKLNLLQTESHGNGSLDFCREILDTVSDFLDGNEPHMTASLQSRMIALLAKQTHPMKPARLFHALHHRILNYSNEYVAILDEHSQFISLNNHYAEVIGYNDSDEVLGLSYEHFKSAASEKADVFKGQDELVLTTKEPLVFLSYHPYWNGTWRLLHGEKTCIFDEHAHAVGIFSRAKDITDAGLVDMSRFLLKEREKNFGKMIRKPFTYYITSERSDHFKLSRKEREVLFYFIRGKTGQEIANILCRSKRTVDMHLETIKIKFNVTSKPDLIEKAIIEGYMTTIPETLLGA